LSDNKIAKATHNMFAYRFLENGIVNERNDDDGEQGASQLILFLMQQHQVLNFMVVVSRWYGGINLGPNRFKIIQNIAKEAMELRNKI
jgi:putative IMPACT (imprinted ancient) family translation regulator